MHRLEIKLTLPTPECESYSRGLLDSLVGLHSFTNRKNALPYQRSKNTDFLIELFQHVNNFWFKSYKNNKQDATV
jgi:hypothetical protein